MRKRRHLCKKLVAVMLAFTMVFQTMPVDVFAEKVEESQPVENANQSSGKSKSKKDKKQEKSKIIGEISEKREEQVKHFLNEDGSFTAVRYADPVHYKEKGKWVDIDNSLSMSSVKIKGKNKNVYKPQKSPVNVEFKENLEDEGTVFLTSEDHQISWTYVRGEDVEFLSEESVELPAEEVVEEVEQDEEASEVQESGEMKATEAQSQSDASEETASVETSIKAEKLEIEQIDKTQDVNSEFTVLENLSDGLCYSEVYPNVDLEYVLDSVYLKENIVLKDKNVANSYRINYQIGDLTAEQVSDHEIQLSDSEGKAVFIIEAPYMSDAEGKVSEEVTFKILSQKDGILKTMLSVDKKWLADESRAYPVKIDPYIYEVVKNFDQDASALYKKNTYPYGTLYVGNDKGSAYGKMKSFVQFSLPTLSAGDIVTGGYLNIAQYAGEQGYSHVGNTSLQINVYRVTSAWKQDTVKASTGYSGLPSVDSKILDYKKVSQKSQMTWVNFDVSLAVKMWYEGTANYGLCLRADDQEAWAVSQFVASDHRSNVDARPTLQITYRNNKGLENYWTYHSQDLGASGAGYVNDYTGNLVMVADILQTPGGRMPLNLSLVYNGYMAAKPSGYVTKCGDGWILSVQQKLTAISSSGSALHKKLYANGYRYIYADSDGTEHYLYQNSDKKMVDEDGLGLTLTVNSSANADGEKYVLADEDGNKITFLSSGYLRRIYDPEGNYIHLAYSSSVSNRIDYIKDGAGRRVTFSYDANNRVTGVTDTAGRVISLKYADTTASRLSRIVYPDGTYTAIEYSDGKILKIRTRDARWLKYTYATSGDAAAKSRVRSVTEYNSSDGGACADANRGGSISFDYAKMNRTRFTDHKKRKEEYSFDNNGRTINVLDASGGSAMYTYQTTSAKDRKANTVTSGAHTSKYVDNLLRGHSFENDLADWSYSSGKTSISTGAGTVYIGKKSVKLNPAGHVHQKIERKEGTYTVSAYIKGTSTESKALLEGFYYNGNAELTKSEASQKFSLTEDWTRVSFTFTLPEGTTYFRPRVKNIGSDDIWVDCVQLENGTIMNPYNMVINGGFEDVNSTVWSMVNCDSGDSYSQGVNYGRSVLVAGDGYSNKRYIQKIPINRKAKDLHFTLSGLSFAYPVPLSESGRKYAIALHTYFTDGTNTIWYQSFNPMCSGQWQFTSGSTGYSGANANKTVDYLYVYCTYYKNANKANFDNIQLNIDETGTAYTYDSKGKLITATDNAGRKQTYTYNNAGELAKATSEDNKEYDYQYATDNPHRLISATSKSSKIKFSFEHNNFGMVTSVKSQAVDDAGAATGQYIESETKYTEDGAYVTETSDDLGNWDSTTYNEDRGTVSSYTDWNGNVTSYSYGENNDILHSVSDGKDSTVSYGYNDANYLTEIQAPGTLYHFTYDTFGKMSTTKAGDHSLITNTYDSRNGNLTSSKYGNGDTIGYSYDSLDRVTAKSYNGEKKFTWTYNAEGQVGKYEDLEQGKTYQSSYDNIGRIMRTDISDGSWFKVNYNTIDQTTGVKYHYADKTQSVNYGYSDRDNLPLDTKFASTGKVANTYDGLARLEKKTYTTDEDKNDIQSEYTYKNVASDENRTTGVLDNIHYVTNGGLKVDDHYYEYDKNGNITSVHAGQDSQSDLRDSYTYDHKNQLIRHDSAVQNKSFTYSYDANGNMQEKKEYPYTTETLGEVDKTIEYKYQDTSWGDLLTSYDGKEIIYDEIGNMTSYDGKTYSWQGRQLREITKGADTYKYTYDADGIRTSKTVNGVKTEYFLNGSQILAQKAGEDTMWFFYDSEGTRVGFTKDDQNYYYLYNATGDVIGIVNASTGEVEATYEYDAWGNCTVTNAEGKSIGTDNPFRYRGYYYDVETGLYYVSSRYYDPEIGRFISADSEDTLAVEHQNFSQNNLYTYCWNNPVNMVDQDGTWPQWVKKAIVVAAVATAVVAVTAITVSTFGAGSLAGVSVISATATLAARATEVTALQIRKSKKEGKSKKTIAKNCIESVYNNAGKIVGLTSVTKTASITAKHVLNRQVAKIFNEKATLKSTLKETGGKGVPYAFVAYNWGHTIYSIFSRNPTKRAARRGYVLK